jgi:hypothetical protein
VINIVIPIILFISIITLLQTQFIESSFNNILVFLVYEIISIASIFTIGLIGAENEFIITLFIIFFILYLSFIFSLNIEPDNSIFPISLIALYSLTSTTYYSIILIFILGTYLIILNINNNYYEKSTLYIFTLLFLGLYLFIIDIPNFKYFSDTIRLFLFLGAYTIVLLFPFLNLLGKQKEDALTTENKNRFLAL